MSENDEQVDEKEEESPDSAERPDEESVESESPESSLVPAEPEEQEPEEPIECEPCKSGSPAWMATFADMATLLMAFFVLILSFAHVNVPKYKEVSGSMRSRFGVQVLVPIVEAPTAENIVATQYRQQATEPTAANVLEEQRSREEQPQDEELDTDDGVGESTTNARDIEEILREEIAEGRVEVSVEDGTVVIESLDQNELSDSTGKISQDTILLLSKISTIQSDTDSLVRVEGAQFVSSGQSNVDASDFGGASQRAEDQLEQIRSNLSEEITQGLAEVFRDGESIIIRLTDQSGFESGSANLRNDFTSLLDSVGDSLAGASGLVQIEGHTDNVAMSFGNRYRNNWDLSSARAASVADYLQEGGSIAPGSMVIKGFADTRPIASNETATGRSENRRIEVVVLPN
ncbi:MAG: flagellar motor protein MotB [Rhodospirillaceae bacterium]|nr:flagellar motor protein MotB [Rhodospirillaceae bacterium]